MIWIVLGIIVVAVVTWLLLSGGKGKTSAPRRKATPSSTSSSLPQVPVHKTWGKRLVIPAGAAACQIAKRFEDNCFAIAKAPILPLAGCTHANCHCRYGPVAERRSHVERRTGVERRPSLRFDMNASQRRTGVDRRAENVNPFAVDRD